jgi:hypothetical protein
MDIRGLLSDPLISFGAAMLDPTGTHGSFGASLSRGLLAQQAMKGSNLNQKAKEQLNKLREQQMAELAKQQQYREQMQQQMSQAAQPQPFKQDLFPGEQPTPGLLSNPNPQEVAQNRMGILGDYVMKTDPVGYYNTMIQQMQPQKPTNAMQRYQEQIALGVDPKIAMGNAFGHPPAASIVNQVGGDLPFKVPTGHMLADQNDPSKGVVPIPGSAQDAQTPEQAGKTQMLRTAQEQLENVNRLVYDKDGTPNWTNITNARIGMPKSEGNQLAASLEFGIQAITRAETGAAMPATEVENTRKRFQPLPTDSEETVEIKMKMFEDFINGSIKLIDPSGRFDSERFEAEMKARQSNGWSIEEVK